MRGSLVGLGRRAMLHRHAGFCMPRRGRHQHQCECSCASRSKARRCMASATANPSVDASAPQAHAADTSQNYTSTRPRILSGVQPTGNIHLGNYMGAMKNWVTFQDQYGMPGTDDALADTFFCIVDLHAITVPHDPAELKRAVRSMAATYMAAGIDPDKAAIFVQSHVPAHAELTWLLSCITPLGWLNRMIQFKEKSRKQGGDVQTGLLTYPILMAADILLYQADLVPVGEDQKQHIELTRDIAERVNHLFGGKKWKKRGGKGGAVFKVPQVFSPPEGARIMSLQDGTSKMSKSSENELSRINLMDSPDVIRNKVKRCKTDSLEGLEYGNLERPECTNLLTIYQLCTNKSKAEVMEECGSLRWGQFKPLLTDALIAKLEPMQQRFKEIYSDSSYVDDVLAQGASIASRTANQTLIACKDAMGFTLPRNGSFS